MFNRKSSIAAALLAVGTVCVGTAHASNVQWSIGINLPPVGTVIASEPVYQAAPTYYDYAPAPVYVQPAPVVVYRPAPRVVYRPEPVYAPRYYGPAVVRAGWAVPGRGYGYGYGHGRDHDHDRYDNRHDHHDGRGDGHWDRGQPEPRRHHH